MAFIQQRIQGEVNALMLRGGDPIQGISLNRFSCLERLLETAQPSGKSKLYKDELQRQLHECSSVPLAFRTEPSELPEVVIDQVKTYQDIESQLSSNERPQPCVYKIRGKQVLFYL